MTMAAGIIATFSEERHTLRVLKESIVGAITEAVEFEKQRWLTLMIRDDTGSGSWQEKDFGPWVNIFTGNHHETYEEAEIEMLNILKQSAPPAGAT